MIIKDYIINNEAHTLAIHIDFHFAFGIVRQEFGLLIYLGPFEISWSK